MLEFQTAQDRQQKFKKVNGIITGAPGVGKTYLARTLDASTTLFIDGEAGTLSLEKSKTESAWQGTTLDIKKMSQKLGVHPWLIARGIASILHGPDMQDPNGFYGQAWYNYYLGTLAGNNPNIFDKFTNIYADSLTVIGRWCFDWCKQQPEAYNDKKKLDLRGVYGTMGIELVNWATILQHQPRNFFLSCILEEDEDDFKRKYWRLQIPGQQAGKQIPGIFDLVMTLAWVDFGEQHGGKHRVLVTQEGNFLGYPAKDRSGLLEPFERPDLGAVIAKIQSFHNQQS